jgi:hypothetical protein
MQPTGGDVAGFELRHGVAGFDHPADDLVTRDAGINLSASLSATRCATGADPNDTRRNIKYRSAHLALQGHGAGIVQWRQT